MKKINPFLVKYVGRNLLLRQSCTYIRKYTAAKGHSHAVSAMKGFRRNSIRSFMKGYIQVKNHLSVHSALKLSAQE
jgi:hypothetical protein